MFKTTRALLVIYSGFFVAKEQVTREGLFLLVVGNSKINLGEGHGELKTFFAAESKSRGRILQL